MGQTALAKRDRRKLSVDRAAAIERSEWVFAQLVLDWIAHASANGWTAAPTVARRRRYVRGRGWIVPGDP